MLIRAGHPPGPMFVVRSGTLRVFDIDPGGQEREIARVGPGDIVGELATLLGRPRNASVRALSESVLETITPEQMRLLAEKSDRFADILLRVAVERTALPLDAVLEQARANHFPLRPPRTEPAEDPPAEQGIQGVLPAPPHDPARVFARQTACPACDAGFHTLVIRNSQDVPSSIETDFHRVYRESPSPYDYAVRVCPRCLYAATSAEWGTVDEQHPAGIRAAAAQVVAALWDGTRPDFQQDRTRALRRASLHLAVASYRVRGAMPLRFASLHHNLAWCDREEGNPDGERAWLRLARQDFQDGFDLIPKNDDKEQLRVLYLCGELALRLDEFEPASLWFLEVLRHPRVKLFPVWEQRARDRRRVAHRAALANGIDLGALSG